MRSTLFVAGFGTRTRAADLAYEFERYGPLVRCDIPAPKKLSSKPYAFVEYEDPRDAEDAFNEMHGRRIDALTISVEWARNAPSASWRCNRSPPRDRRRSMSPNAPLDYLPHPADLSPPAPTPTYPAGGPAPLSPGGRMNSPKDMPPYSYREDGYRSPPPPMNQSYHRMAPYPPPRRSSPPPYMHGRSRSPPPYPSHHHHHHLSGPPPPSRHSHYHRHPSYRQPYHHNHRYLPDMDRRPDSPPSRRRYYSRSPPPPGPPGAAASSSAGPYEYQQRRRSYSPSPSRDDVRDTDLSSVSSSPSKSKYDHPPHHHNPYHHHPYHHQQQHQQHYQHHHHRLYRSDRSSLSGSPPSYRRPVSPVATTTNDTTANVDAMDPSVARSPTPAYGQRSPSPPVLEY